MTLTSRCLGSGFLISSFLAPAMVLAQGSLTPPGPPGAAFKTLAQVEPRTPVDAVHTPAGGFCLFAITQPGSYYLTTNVISASTGGIAILTNNVTLDLNGFSVIGNNAYEGISVGAGTNIIVRNGIVTGWYDGVFAAASFATPTRNLVLEHLQVVTNIGVGVICYGATISDCLISDSGNEGVRGITDYGTLTHCRVERSQANGISVRPSAHWVISDNQFIANNLLNGNTNAAIYLVSDSNLVRDNYIAATGPAGNGIFVWNYISYTNNVIVRNTVTGGGANNYSIANSSAQDVGPIGSAATATSPFANLSR